MCIRDRDDYDKIKPILLYYQKIGYTVIFNTEIAYMGCRTRVIGDVTSPDNEVVTCLLYTS